MRISLLLSSLFVFGGLLSAQSGLAQSTEGPEAEPAGLILTEPDSVLQHLFRRMHVRSVAKIRLNDDGEVRDTVTYQQVDTQGRSVQLDHHLNPQLHRQWSYNAQGYCTSQVTHPTPSQPLTFIYSYNPALRRGLQEVLKPNGSRTTLTEVTLQQRADTLLTDVVTHGLLVNSTIYNRESRQRSLSFAPHPDTLLILRYGYSNVGQLISATANYRVSHQGRLVEVGRLDLRRAAKEQKVKVKAGQAAPMLTYAQALLALRESQGRYAQHRWYYDEQQRVKKQETFLPTGQSGQYATVAVEFTYDAHNRVVGREQSASSIYSPGQKTYSVYSYSPTGLLLGETTDTRTEKPVFYRYLYTYYN